MDGFGGMVGLELAGGAKATDRFVRKLRIVRHAPSLGGVDSLVSEPRRRFVLPRLSWPGPGGVKPAPGSRPARTRPGSGRR